MSPPTTEVIDLSEDDEEDRNNLINLTTPIPNPRKRPKSLIPLDCIDVDDSPTSVELHKSAHYTTSFVPETPLSTPKHPPLPIPSSIPPLNYPGDDGLLCDGSDDETGGLGRGTCLKNIGTCIRFDAGNDLGKRPECTMKEKQWENKESVCDIDVDSWLDIDSTFCLHTEVQSNVHVQGGNLGKRSNLKSKNTYDRSHMEDDTNQMQPIEYHDHEKENVRLEKVDATGTGHNGCAEKKQKKDKQAIDRKKLMEEKMRKKELEKERKATLKADAAKHKQLEKEMKKLEKFKFSEKDIVAVIHPDVLLGSLGGKAGPLLTMFAQKHLSREITRNPIGKSIVWRMNPPEEISQFASVKADIHYILLIYDNAEEFCNHANDGTLVDHISSVRKHYPSYTICCLTNGLMSFVNRREQQKYKNQKIACDWKRPPVEELFAKLTTQFANVHTRQCADEAEVAEHVVGLTINLAKCHSRKRLTHLSVNANGCNVPKGCVDRGLIMKNPWLKALVSIPKVQPRFALAIWKKYPTMKSLLRVYMDPTKTVDEKESILEELPLQGVLGDEDIRLGKKCSKRVFRILMAQNGSIKTDDVEDGADLSQSQ